MIEYVFLLAFPAVAFLGGIYLIHRGIGRLNQKRYISVSGTAKSQQPLVSPFSKQKCIYCKVIVDYLGNGTTPWNRLHSMECKVPFLISGNIVNPEYADIRASDSRAITGYMRHEMGFIEQFKDSVSKAEPVQMVIDVARATSFAPVEIWSNEFLDDGTSATLKSIVPKKLLDPHTKQAFRITEYFIPEGTIVHVTGDSTNSSLAGTLEYPLLISDSGKHNPKETMKEKAFLSIGLGAVMVLVSLMIAYFSLPSL